jgi:aryl-alcohol dehydrogenase-like predicted oxidoreductase
MRYRQLGSSSLEVSEISLGSWLTFSGGVAFEQTRACTDAAFEVGINFFDTANVYGRGAAESAWGEILSRRPRDSYVLDSTPPRRVPPSRGITSGLPYRTARAVAGGENVWGRYVTGELHRGISRC